MKTVIKFSCQQCTESCAVDKLFTCVVCCIAVCVSHCDNFPLKCKGNTRNFVLQTCHCCKDDSFEILLKIVDDCFIGSCLQSSCFISSAAASRNIDYRRSSFWTLFFDIIWNIVVWRNIRSRQRLMSTTINTVTQSLTCHKSRITGTGA